jgi:hypothetical protein
LTTKNTKSTKQANDIRAKKAKTDGFTTPTQRNTTNGKEKGWINQPGFPSDRAACRKRVERHLAESETVVVLILL